MISLPAETQAVLISLGLGDPVRSLQPHPPQLHRDMTGQVTGVSVFVYGYSYTAH